MINVDISERKALLFPLLRKHSRSQKLKKKRKMSTFGLDTFLVKGSNIENIATSVRTENVRLGIFQIFNIGYILMSFTYSCQSVAVKAHC